MCDFGADINKFQSNSIINIFFVSNVYISYISTSFGWNQHVYVVSWYLANTTDENASNKQNLFSNI